MQIYLVLTLDCNLNCSHCIRNFTAKPYENINTYKIQSFLESVAKINPETRIVLTGGEPTLHRDFFKIVSIASNLFKDVTICSNGIYKNKTLEEICKLKNIKIQVSIDGNQKSHDKIRGSGTFLRSLNAIKELVSHSILVRVSTTVNSENIDVLFDLADILSSLKINSWQISPEQAFSKLEEKKQIDMNAWNIFVDKILEKVKIPVQIKKMFDFQLFEKMEKIYGENFLKIKSQANCGCFTSKLYVYPDLSVRCCTCMDSVILGNLSKNTYEEILKKMEEKKALLTIKENSPCSKCKWLYLCNGGCPGYSKYYFGDIGFGDMRCPKVKEFYGL